MEKRGTFSVKRVLNFVKKAITSLDSTEIGVGLSHLNHS